jgi:hypothetical protein
VPLACFTCEQNTAVHVFNTTSHVFISGIHVNSRDHIRSHMISCGSMCSHVNTHIIIYVKIKSHVFNTSSHVFISDAHVNTRDHVRSHVTTCVLYVNTRTKVM